MSIFDVFSFKKEAAKVFTKENFQHILETARAEIIKQAKANIPGIEKKLIVDKAVIAKIEILSIALPLIEKAIDLSEELALW